MKHWYLLQTKFKQEMNVEMRLTQLQYEAYLPLAPIDRREPKHSKLTVEPLYATYCFFRMDVGVDDFHPITNIPGVLRIVKMTRDKDGYFCPTIIPDKKIAEIRADEDEMGVHRGIKSEYAEGDAVRFKSGALKDHQGRITKLRGKTGEERAMVLIGELEVDTHVKDLQPAA